MPSSPGEGFNHAPLGVATTVVTPEDTPYLFQASDFGFSDPNDSPANNFQAVKIASLPAAGSLTLNSQPVLTKKRGRQRKGVGSDKEKDKEKGSGPKKRGRE